MRRFKGSQINFKVKTKFGNLIRTQLHQDFFSNFSRPRAHGKPQLKVKVRILKVLKLSKYPTHPAFQFEAIK